MTCPMCGSPLVEQQDTFDFFCTQDNALECVCLDCDFSWLVDVNSRQQKDVPL